MIFEMIKKNVKDKKQCVFDQKAQMQLISNNSASMDYLKQSKSIKDWNDRREAVKRAFNGLANENKKLLELMFLGYTDTVLFRSIKSKLV